MNTKLSAVASANKQAAVSAAVLETGRIANNKAVQLVSKQLPMMVRGYADTPFGKLAIANAVLMAVSQFKPDSEALVRISNAMVVDAYQQIIQSFDVEGMLDSLVNDAKVTTALKKLAKTEDE